VLLEIIILTSSPAVQLRRVPVAHEWLRGPAILKLDM
jgi:hypothetical protein